jgi:hypothetical protein
LINALMAGQPDAAVEGWVRKMGAVAPTLFGAIKLLVNNRTAISEF